MENNLKFCVNCKFYLLTSPEGYHTTYVCAHPLNIEICLVTGKNKYKKTPYELRNEMSFNNACGQQAQWFERKEEKDIPF